MDDDEDVHDQVSDAEDVGVIGFGLCPREELQHAPDSQQLVDADLRVVEAQEEIEDVCGQHGDNIQAKLEGAGVAIPQQLLIFHQQTLFQVTCM